jgi:hypothetical protein
MSRDELSAFAIIAPFATWGTLHVLTAVKLFQRRPRWHGLVALVVLPLAPYWAAKASLRVRAIAWVSTLVLWAAARLLLAR